MGEAAKTLARGAASAVVVRGLGIVGSLGLTVALAWYLEPERLGEFLYLVAWAQTLALPGAFGLELGAARYVAEYRAEGQWDHLRGFTGFALRTTAYASAGCGLALVIGRVVVAPGWPPGELLATVLCGLALVPLTALTRLGIGYLRGLREIAGAYGPVTVVAPVLVFVGVAALTGGELGSPPLASLVAVQVLAMATAVVLQVGLARRALPAAVIEASPRSHAAAWTATARSLFFISGFRVLLGEVDLLVLGAFRSGTEVAVYAMVMRLAKLATFGLVAVNTIAAPMIAARRGADQGEDLAGVVRLASRWIVLACLPCAGALFLGAEQVLGLLGPAYVEGATAMRILVVGFSFACLCGPANNLLLMTGHHDEAKRVFLVVMAGNLASNMILVPWMGAEGAAIAAALSLVGLNESLRRLAWSRLQIASGVLGRPSS